MKRIRIVGGVPASPCQTGAEGHSSFVTQIAHVLTAVGTVVTALAAFVACAAALNTWSVSVLAAAWVVAGWLARGRRCHCAADRKHARSHQVVEGAV